MASSDANVAQQERDRVARLESDSNSFRTQFQQMADQLNYLTNQVKNPPPP